MVPLIEPSVLSRVISIVPVCCSFCVHENGGDPGAEKMVSGSTPLNCPLYCVPPLSTVSFATIAPAATAPPTMPIVVAETPPPPAPCAAGGGSTRAA